MNDGDDDKDEVIRALQENVKAALDAGAVLEAENARLRTAYFKMNEEVSQTLGKALGYPWFKDDPKNFPDATEEQGVCVGDHVAESLADEAADRLKTQALPFVTTWAALGAALHVLSRPSIRLEVGEKLYNLLTDILKEGRPYIGKLPPKGGPINAEDFGVREGRDVTSALQSAINYAELDALEDDLREEEKKP
jgi:hypothetical protein